MISYIFSGASFLMAIWFMLSIALKFSPKLRLLFKAIPGFLFVGVAVAAYFESTSAPLVAFLYVLIGLIFGMIGDAMLAMRDVQRYRADKFLILGIAAFSIGHIMYVMLYSTLFSITFLQPLIALVAAVLVVCGAKAVKLNFRNMTIPVFIYAFIILFMLTCSITTLIVSPITISTIVLTVGAGLFVVSDMVLCFIFFKDKVPKVLGAINLTAYFLAQILIALSLLFL